MMDVETNKQTSYYTCGDSEDEVDNPYIYNLKDNIHDYKDLEDEYTDEEKVDSEEEDDYEDEEEVVKEEDMEMGRYWMRQKYDYVHTYISQNPSEKKLKDFFS